MFSLYPNQLTHTTCLVAQISSTNTMVRDSHTCYVDAPSLDKKLKYSLLDASVLLQQ